MGRSSLSTLAAALRVHAAILLTIGAVGDPCLGRRYQTLDDDAGITTKSSRPAYTFEQAESIMRRGERTLRAGGQALARSGCC